MPDGERAITLRLPAQLAARLETVAKIDQMPVAEVVRQAVAAYVEARYEDDAFRAKAQRVFDGLVVLARAVVTMIGEPDA